LSALLFLGATGRSKHLLSLTISVNREESVRMRRNVKTSPETNLQTVEEAQVIVTADCGSSKTALEKRKEDANQPLYLKRV
jgi:hypothetical protein